MGYSRYDMHCHLGFADDPRAFASEGAGLSLAFLSTTVTPAEYEHVLPSLEGERNVACGLGYHPWWIDADSDVERFSELLSTTSCVGEVGLDFSKEHLGYIDDQERVFRAIVRSCAREGGKVISIHSVRSASRVLEILEEEGTFESCTCIFHWFTGSSDELHDAIHAGASFSVGLRMMQTRKGKEYARQIPLDRLMLETDLPPEGELEMGKDDTSPSSMSGQASSPSFDADPKKSPAFQLSRLESARDAVIAARTKNDPDEVVETMRMNSSRILSLARRMP